MADQSDVARQLLDLAREDLLAAKALNEAEGVSASKSGFNAQQAVEMALLAGRGKDFPFTHDIALLIDSARTRASSFLATFANPIA